MASAVEIHRAGHEAFNARDWERLRSLLGRDLVYTDHARGLTIRGGDEFLAWLQEWVAGASDCHIEDDRFLDAGTHSVCQCHGRGVNDGPMGPAQATGRSMDVAICEILRVEGDRITGGDEYYDTLTLLAQLGVAEPQNA